MSTELVRAMVLILGLVFVLGLTGCASNTVDLSSTGIHSNGYSCSGGDLVELVCSNGPIACSTDADCQKNFCLDRATVGHESCINSVCALVSKEPCTASTLCTGGQCA